MARYGSHEQVVFFHDPLVHLKGIIAIHNTSLGPALGGCRMWPYTSEEEALGDVLKLSRGMTYKAAVAGLNLGGGKAVIIGSPRQKTPELFRVFGRFVESLNGRYITAEDAGTSVEDMRHIRKNTSYVAGLPQELGGAGDPSPFTALSTLTGMKAAVQHKMKESALKNLHVAVQGMGHVGSFLAEYLLKEGCQLSICDFFNEKALNFKARHPEVEVVPHEKIYEVDSDIFAPCALGAVLTPETVKKLKCAIIAGAANNQLDRLSTEELIREKNILYAPDFVINAGGLIHVYVESLGQYQKEEAERKISGVYDTLMEIFSKSHTRSATEVAIEMAEQRISKKTTEPSACSV